MTIPGLARAILEMMALGTGKHKVRRRPTARRSSGERPAVIGPVRRKAIARRGTGERSTVGG